MKVISANETLIEGQWLFDGNEVVGDDECERVKWLISKYLKRIGVDKSGWETLYQDPKDKRLWVHYYPQSEMHGGGPPALKIISPEEAKNKFKV